MITLTTLTIVKMVKIEPSKLKTISSKNLVSKMTQSILMIVMTAQLTKQFKLKTKKMFYRKYKKRTVVMSLLQVLFKSNKINKLSLN